MECGCFSMAEIKKYLADAPGISEMMPDEELDRIMNHVKDEYDFSEGEV
jgi:hypothetical protein